MRVKLKSPLLCKLKKIKTTDCKKDRNGIYYPQIRKMEVFMMTITKDTVIGDILTLAPDTAPLFLSIGMHCLGCPASRSETVEQACMAHDVDADELLAKVNEAIAAQG